MGKLIYMLSIFAFCSGLISVQAQKVKIDPNERYDLYLLIGQSNMAGRGTIEAQDTITDPKVFMLNKAGNWVPAKSPLHFDKAIAGTGLGLTFGKIVAKKAGEKSD